MEAFTDRMRRQYSLDLPSSIRLASITTDVTIGRNEDLQSIGHTCRTLYYVEAGLLRVYYFLGDADVTESFEPEGSFVARAESLFSGRPSRKGIRAVEDTRLMAIDTRGLYASFDAYPPLERMFRKITEEAYVKAIQRQESLQFHSPEERYQLLLENQPDIVRRAPLKFIASYLGITAVSLSRIRARH
jgi:CRP-like cAMP-binding protein